MEEYLDEMREEMGQALEALDVELGKIRTGRATPKLLDSVQVEVAAYGASMPLNQLATIQAPDARLLTVSPWDKTTLGDIERAIIVAGLGLNPSSDGQIVRVPVPPLTQDRRKELVRNANRLGEDIKVRVRRIRRDYNDTFRGAEKDGDISEDDLRGLLSDVQTATDDFVKKVDAKVNDKTQEVLEV